MFGSKGELLLRRISNVCLRDAGEVRTAKQSGDYG